MTGVLLSILMAMLFATTASASDDNYILVQSTTSTKNSGLFDAVLPQFTAASGIEVRVIAVGTGQALKNATNGDGDVLLVHAKEAEERFVADGYGVRRLDLMYNDFVLVGPGSDPAHVRASTTALDAFHAIRRARTPFVSRGDDSGTHKKELALWREAGVDVSQVRGGWYRETGSGMGATLNVAAGMNAYALTDRATWVAFGNKQDLVILNEGGARLFNQYGIIVVNPARHPHVNVAAANAFVRWMTGPQGQAAIAAFRLEGQQLFTPNASTR